MNILLRAAVAAIALGSVVASAVAQVGTAPRVKAPKFEQLLWQDAFGIDYESGENVLLLGQAAADGTRPLVALDAVGSPIVWETHESVYEELFVMPFEFEASESEILTIQNADEIMVLNIEITRNIGAGRFTGSTGVDFIVTGVVYDIIIEQIPAPQSGAIEFSFFFPTERHLDEAAALAFAVRDPDIYDWPEPAFEEEVDCEVERLLCYRLASTAYRIGLAANCDGIDWHAVSIAGGAGAGAGFVLGGAIGGVLTVGILAIPSAGVGTIVGGALGGIAGEVISDQLCRSAQKRIYFANLDDCDARYDYCVLMGEWPEQ